MTFTMSAKMSGLSAALDAADIKARMGAMKAMGKARDGMLDELQTQTGSILGARMSRTWKGKVYPASGSSLTPAAYVWSKAPGIIDAYARGVTIYPTAGRRLLALPTDDTPLKRQGNALTPREVEARYGKRLRLVPAKSAQGSRIGGRAVAYLLLDNLVLRDRGNRHRNASARELKAAPGKGKPVESIVMFVLVASVKVPKKLDLNATLARASATLPQLLDQEWSA